MLLSGKPALSFTTWNEEFHHLLKAHSAQTQPVLGISKRESCSEACRGRGGVCGQEAVSMWVSLQGAFPKWRDWIWGISCETVWQFTQMHKLARACARSVYIHLCLLAGPFLEVLWREHQGEKQQCANTACPATCPAKASISFWPQGLHSSHQDS